jgi:uncharacterized protein YerC
MPRVSRKQLGIDIHNQLEDNFSFLISSLQNAKDIEDFFGDFFSSEEKTMLTKRLMLHCMLYAGYSTSQIHAVLGVSQETIRVHKHLFKNGGETYKKIIRKISDREKTKEFWSKVEEILKPVGLLLKSKSDMKARAKLLSGDYH